MRKVRDRFACVFGFVFGDFELRKYRHAQHETLNPQVLRSIYRDLLESPRLSAGEPLIIMDAYADARFNTEIDRKTGARPGEKLTSNPKPGVGFIWV